MDDPYVPIENLAKHFTVSVSTIRAWVRQDYIPAEAYIKVGNTYRFCIPKVIAGLTQKAEKASQEVVPHTPVPETPAPDAPVQLELDLNPDKDI